MTFKVLLSSLPPSDVWNILRITCFWRAWIVGNASMKVIFTYMAHYSDMSSIQLSGDSRCWRNIKQLLKKINTTFILLSIQNFFNCLEDAVQQHCQMYGQHILFIVCHISILFNPKIMIYLNPFGSLNLSMTSKPFRNDEISKGLFNQNIKVGLRPTDEFLWHSIYFHRILAELEIVLDNAQHFVGGVNMQTLLVICSTSSRETVTSCLLLWSWFEQRHHLLWLQTNKRYCYTLIMLFMF